MTTYPSPLTYAAEPEAVHPGKQYLMPNHPISVCRTGQILRVYRGVAWVTMGCRDYVVRAGESLRLAPGAHDAVIEAMQRLPLLYELERA